MIGSARFRPVPDDSCQVESPDPSVTPQLHLLIATSDATLRAELQSAVSALAEDQIVVHLAADLRQAVEAARNRQPHLVLAELGQDVRNLVAFVREVSIVSPATTTAAAFDPRRLGADASESEVMICALRGGVQDFLRRPLGSGDLRQLCDRLLAKFGAAPDRRTVGKTVVFLSNKGGVGKSTLATNVACGLARRHPDRVLLIDASLQQGVCAALLDVRPTTTLTDAVRQRQRIDEVLLRQLVVTHPCGLDLLAAPSGAVEAAEIDDEGMTGIVMLARRTYDYVIVDTFPVFDRIVMALLDLADRAYLTFENVVPTLLGAVKFIELLNSLSYAAERQRIVLNRYTTSSGNPSRRDVAERLGRSVDHVVPFDRRIVAAANSGKPFALRSTRWFATGRALNRLVVEVEELGLAEPTPKAV